MKITKILLLIVSTFFISFSTVFALEYDINGLKFSDDITFEEIYYNNNIDVFLNKDLQANNNSIQYQLISSNKETIDSISAKFLKLTQDISSCLENVNTLKTQAESLLNNVNTIKEDLINSGISDYESNEEYINAYSSYQEAQNNYQTAVTTCQNTQQTALNDYISSLPQFNDANWNTQPLSGEENNNLVYTISNVPLYSIAWIKAKNANNEDIYNVFFTNDQKQKNDINNNSKPSNIQNNSVKTPNTKLNKSIISIVCGIIIIVIGCSIAMLIYKKPKRK